MRRWLAVVLVVLAAACTGEEADPRSGASSEPTPGSAVTPPAAPECPDLPQPTRATAPVPLWPGPGAEDLVPDITYACETPVAPELFGLLNEDPTWEGDAVEAAALGVLHRDGGELGTFTTAQLREPVLQEYEKEARAAGLTTTNVGSVTLAWGRSGDHVSVSWLDGSRLVNLTAEGSAQAAYAVTLWLTARGTEGAGVIVPGKIPEITRMPAALIAGPPLEALPEGYTAIRVDPAAFNGADFAEDLTTRDRETIEALGAAIVLDEDGEVVGTAVAGAGAPSLAEWTEKTEAAAATGFVNADVHAFVVGYDLDVVDAFVRSWGSNAGPS